MRRTLILLVPLALAGAAASEGAMSQDRRSTTLRPPRDGNVAVQEELDAARRAGTIAAYDLFIARHPEHPLAAAARREREELVRRGRPRPAD
jgi:hypothetical protein